MRLYRPKLLKYNGEKFTIKGIDGKEVGTFFKDTAKDVYMANKRIYAKRLERRKSPLLSRRGTKRVFKRLVG
jgi:hypothetical protein